MWLASTLLLSLRIAPVFAFAPPFSLVPVPPTLRVLFGMAIAASLVSAYPQAARITDLSPGVLTLTAARELLLGSMVVLAFQLPFAALYLAGRTIDIQAGLGLAVLIDPTTRTQSPVVGTLFAYAAAMVFFGLNGHQDLLRMLGASLDAVPLGRGEILPSLAPLTAYISAVFLAGFGVGGMVILSIFLTDLTITMLSRTVPQMNVLVLGFQVKTIVLLLTLPLSLGVAGALLARLMAYTLQSVPRLL